MWSLDFSPKAVGSFEGVLSREWSDQIAFQKYCLEETGEGSQGTKVKMKAPPMKYVVGESRMKEDYSGYFYLTSFWPNGNGWVLNFNLSVYHKPH